MGISWYVETPPSGFAAKEETKKKAMSRLLMAFFSSTVKYFLGES